MKRRRYRSVEEKLAIMKELDDRRAEGRSLQPVFRREKLHYGTVVGWKRQLKEGTIEDRSRFSKVGANRRKAAPETPLPRAPAGTLQEALQRLIDERDMYKRALEQIQAHLRAQLEGRGQ